MCSGNRFNPVNYLYNLLVEWQQGKLQLDTRNVLTRHEKWLMAGIKPSFVGYWLKIQTRSLAHIQTRRNINCLWAIIYLKAEIPDHLPRWFFINFICPCAPANIKHLEKTHTESGQASGKKRAVCIWVCFLWGGDKRFWRCSLKER